MIVSAMDVGGTHVAVANVDLATRSLVPGQSGHAPLDCSADAAQVVSTLARCAVELPRRDDVRWAIALPGPFDYARGIGRYADVGKFDALRDYDLGAALSPLLPGSRHVSFHNDAEAFLLGEWWAGAARGHRRAVGITLGTGVGSCFLADGQVVRHGPGIPPDGRVDLLRYAGKPLEETVSRQAIRRAYAHATGDTAALDVREIAHQARHSGTVAGVFRRTFHALGTVLGPCITAFDPSILVIGGAIAASWDLIAEPLRAGFACAERVLVQPAQHRIAAPLLGAAFLGQHRTG
ncbi:MAG TPA: ROK family protein [Pseudonocardiaceae bacterium]|nr:ROK family protein [Pseudonocardiaceae bacterium]